MFGFLIVALVLGGASRHEVITSDIVSLVALPVLGMAIFRLRARFDARWRLPLIILAGTALLPLLQLIPLPPALWTALPGRAPIAEAMTLAGVAHGWAPLSLSPQTTWVCFLSLFPPVTMLVAGLTVDPEWRWRMVLAVVGAGVVGVLLGALQVAGGDDSALRFYAVTNDTVAVGFFSNRNHFASFLICVTVLATGVAAAAVATRPVSRPLLLFGLGAAALALAGVGMTGSRAGLVLLAPAGLGALAMAWRAGLTRGRAGRGLAVLAVVFVASVLLVQATFGQAIGRIQAGFTGEVRVIAAASTVSAIKAFSPVGSGFGTFVPVYKMYEAPDAVINTYINHAHDDWLEVVLEGGVPAILLLAAFLVWFGRRALELWRSDDPSLTVARAASVCVVLMLAHSFGDYPLRAPMMATLFALCCAMMLAYGPQAPQHLQVRSA